MTSEPKISICIAAYSGTFLSLAINSVLCQEFESFEILVGDDSGGTLRKLIESYDNPKIRYLPNATNLGYAKNTCNLMDNASGQYLALLQHDDAFEQGFLECAARTLDNNSEIAVFLGASDDVDAHSNVIGPRPTSMLEGIISDPLNELLSPDAMVFLPSATVVRRSAVKLHMSPWPDNAVADYSMYVELAQAECKFYYSPEARVLYRIHPGQLSEKRISHRSSVIDLWSRFSFQRRQHEEKRIRMLAKATFARAGGLVRLNDGRQARKDLLAARSLEPSIVSLKWISLWIMTYLPWLVPPAISLWQKLRDPYAHRYQGI